MKCTNTHPVVYKCSDIPMACRCVGGRRGPQRKAPGWRKPKMLWSLCQRRWRSPSYPDPHHDLLRSSTRRHSPNGTPRSRWDGSVIVHRSLLFTIYCSDISRFWLRYGLNIYLNLNFLLLFFAHFLNRYFYLPSITESTWFHSISGAFWCIAGITEETVRQSGSHETHISGQGKKNLQHFPPTVGQTKENITAN